MIDIIKWAAGDYWHVATGDRYTLCGLYYYVFTDHKPHVLSVKHGKPTCPECIYILQERNKDDWLDEMRQEWDDRLDRIWGDESEDAE